MGQNPRYGPVVITLALPRTGPTRLDVFDSTGRRVRTLLDRVTDAGFVRLSWDGSDARGTQRASGLYFVRLTAPGGMLSRKLSLVR